MTILSNPGPKRTKHCLPLSTMIGTQRSSLMLPWTVGWENCAIELNYSIWINLNICRCRQNNNNDDLYSSLTIVESLLVLLMMVFSPLFYSVLFCFFSVLLCFTSKTFLRGGGWHHLTSWQAWHRCCNYGKYQTGRALSWSSFWWHG